MDPSIRPPVAPWAALAASQWPPVRAALTNHQFLYSYIQDEPEVRRGNRELLPLHSKSTGSEVSFLQRGILINLL